MAPASAGRRVAGQRRLPGNQPRPALVPARRDREDLHRHLPRQLPAEKRELLTVAARRVAGVTIPPLKHFGPLLVVWGATMIMLVFIRDLGSSLMFFGAFLALLYVATARLSYVIAGLVLFFVGATLIASQIAHVRRPRRHLGHSKPLATARRGRARRPDPAVAVRPGRRRLIRAGPGRVAAQASGAVRPALRAAVPGLRQHPARAAHGRDLRADRLRARPVRRCGRDRSSTR